MREDLLPRFVRVPAGDFTIGADDGEDDERPARRVHVDAFAIAVHAVTNTQYAEFVRHTGHRAPGVRELPIFVSPASEPAYRELASPYVWRGGEPPRDRGAHPVTLITHGDALVYCQWLSGRAGRTVRLPSEAEWERAARGGLEGWRYPWGDEISPERANYLPDPGLKRQRGTRPVGSYPPNGFGLYDMAGNVWEWVAEWYRADAYRESDADTPVVTSGLLRVLRGGSWVSHDLEQLRCAHRHKVPLDSYAYSIGFRVVYSEVDDATADGQGTDR